MCLHLAHNKGLVGCLILGSGQAAHNGQTSHRSRHSYVRFLGSGQATHNGQTSHREDIRTSERLH